jgi:geranylgeranyl pyrophosphate synthase
MVQEQRVVTSTSNSPVTADQSTQPFTERLARMYMTVQDFMCGNASLCVAAGRSIVTAAGQSAAVAPNSRLSLTPALQTVTSHEVHCHAGYTDAMALARQEADLAIEALECLPPSEERASLRAMVDYVLVRMY